MRKRESGNDSRQPSAEGAEPIGIVISRGSHTEEAPRFAAYVWGPVPDEEGAKDCVAVA